MKKPGLTFYKSAAIVLIIIFGAFQIGSPAIENPPVTSEIVVPKEVKQILERACYDCHSNEAKVEWFDRIAPASFLVAHDVNEARARFNFSEWDRNPPAVQELLLWEMVNAIDQQKMPLQRYRLAHPGGKVSASELTVLKQYVNTLPGRHKVDTVRIVARSLTNDKILTQKTPVSLNGIPYSADYKNWKIISVTDKFDGGSMRIVYGNDILVKALKNHQLPFPDGSRVVKVVWGKQVEDKDGNVLPGNFQNAQFMIKDSKKYSSTEGWGFAKFDGLDLKPAGKTVLFEQTCANCHRLLAPENDFVFNIPTK
ncbi:heme-binding domain-containing protein [Dyadobacter sp. CY351]|uniref:heme-binding domain-containing protein n=1 Tax=Dyadobacter sp. CY351 TaxID=2909337 RepID=UPI001F18911A|nr:heme-binding domain-containing protein [Dyadobacter sp. CY351]MCF2517724.1 heme-binding domain-containing protein [Dyadobacter sp. CY351]